VAGRSFNIGQLTDVSRCNLQQYLLCNQRQALRYRAQALPGTVAQDDWRCP
jgi:hypothetical protein